MAPARRMRSSRLASPMVPTMDEGRSVTDAVPLPPKSTEWVEPHLRPSAPSYRDYANHYQGNSSTKYMKALGQRPTQADKEKIFHVDKRDKKRGVRKDTDTREATPGVPRESEARVSEPRVSAPPSTNGKDVDGDYVPQGSLRAPLTKAKDQLQPKPFDPDDPKGPMRLKGVIEAVIQRATARKTLELGRAVERVWHDSFQEPAIADLIDAVLTQRPKPEQTAEFQRRVKDAKAQIKEAEALTKNPSTDKGSKSKTSSPLANGDRGSVKRRLEVTDESSEAPGSNINGASANPAMQQHDENMNAHGTPSKRSTKRMKRSTSTSSLTSSLSSISSSEHDLPPPTASDPAATIPPESSTSSSDKPQVWPKMHSFLLNNQSKSSNKRSISSPAPSVDDTPEEAAAKRRKLQKTFDVTVNNSELREPLTTISQQMAESPPAESLPPRSKSSRMRNGTTPHGLDEDYGAESSLSPPPTNGDLLAPPSADDHLLARGTTPTRLGRPPKYPRKGARIKMSPQKSKGITAGRARPSGDAEIADLSENESKDRDNEDNCAACGGTGALLCCDSCIRSFHFTCLEPPQDAENAPEGKWYCRACIAQQHDRAVRSGNDFEEDPREIVPDVDGVFKPLFTKLHGKTEHSYTLPKVVAEAFEGVKMGETGEYEEPGLPRNRVRDAADTLADMTKFRESTDNATKLCFACGGSNNDYWEQGNNPDAVPREMVSCDYCILNWHLDCLDPPKASNPKLVIEQQDELMPAARGKGKKKDKSQTVTTWMCPNHITDDPNRDNHQGHSRVINGSKIGKIRRPKHATIKDVSLRRGFHNNGLIEVLNDLSDTEKEEDEPGVIYRIPEKSIKLDFIDRSKKESTRTHPSTALTKRDVTKMRHAAMKRQREKAATLKEMEELRKRTFAEQQVAIALKQMASSSSEPASGPASQVGTSPLDNLIATLIHEAPENVAGLYEKEEKLTEDQKSYLKAAKEKIEALLGRV